MKQDSKTITIKVSPRLYRKMKDMGVSLGHIGISGIVKRAIKKQLKEDEVFSITEETK